MKNTKFLKLVLLSMIFISPLNAFDFGFITKLFSKKIVKSGNIKSNDTIKKIAISISSGILLGSAVLFVYWFSHRDKNKQNSNSGQDNNDKNPNKIKKEDCDHKDSVKAENKEAVKNNETEPNSKENISKKITNVEQQTIKKTDNKSDNQDNREINQDNKENNNSKETEDNKTNVSVELIGNCEKQKTKAEIEDNEELLNRAKELIEEDFVDIYKKICADRYFSYSIDLARDIKTIIRLLEFIDLDRAKKLINKIENSNYLAYEDLWSYKKITIKMIQLLIGDDVNKADAGGNTQLHLACLHNNLEVVKQLLKYKDINVNQTTNNGCTPLSLASFSDDIEIIKLLLKNGANVDICDSDGLTVFYKICSENKLGLAKLFIENGVDINKKCECIGWNRDFKHVYGWNSPLYIACKNGHLEIVKILLEYGAEIDKKSINKIKEYVSTNKIKEYVSTDNYKEILKYLNLTNKFNLWMQTYQPFDVPADEKNNNDLCEFKNRLLASKRAEDSLKNL